jgi:subfamily B ATP-binding cassette protein MsbA
VVPPTILAGAAFARRLRKLSRRFQDAVADANADAEEAIANIRMVQAFTSEPVEERRYQAGIERSYQLALSRVLVRAWFIPTVIFAMFGGITAVFWFGGRQVIAGDLAAGDLIAFLLLSLFIAGSVAGFTGLFSQLQEGLGASRRIFDLLNETPTVREPAEPRSLQAGASDVRFANVWFRYPAGIKMPSDEDDSVSATSTEQTWVLSDVSLHVQAGETLAVVGESGAGKSTLASLIPRFFDVQQGSVEVGGIDVRDVHLEDLRSRIAIVPQETALFSGSVKDNIRYGRPNASDAEVQAAAEAAHVTEFVQTLPDGWASMIGERGVRLSGGQRQRIAIARALLKDPPILILDEATSNLDAASEALVQAALQNLKHGRTSLVIAHRFSTIQDADRIAVLNRGRLETVGPHEVLMETSSTYRRLYRHQLAGGMTPTGA